jgi:hypothetical protein
MEKTAEQKLDSEIKSWRTVLLTRIKDGHKGRIDIAVYFLNMKVQQRYPSYFAWIYLNRIKRHKKQDYDLICTHIKEHLK